MLATHTLALLAAALPTPPIDRGQDPPFDEKALGAAVDAARERAGLRGVVVGVRRSGDQLVLARGNGGKDVARPLDGDTLFEIGSVTKAFTGILLAIAVARGEVQLDTPVQELLPDGVAVPAHGRAITLLDLATHRSALPRLPPNLKPKNVLDPYADYGAEQLWLGLEEIELRREVGSRYEYSNLGAGLLGQALALRAGVDYATLLRQRVLEPLEMRDTALAVTADDEPRLAQPHAEGGARCLSWRFDGLAGCGGLRSTVHDLLRFSAANLGLVETPIAEALTASHVPRGDAGGKVKVALGWHVTTWGEDDPVVWHNGRTGGYASIVMLRPKSAAAVVVLTNRSASVDELGNELMRLVCAARR
jgi:CubicO group peptidase (beta-lactamase class C family)